MLTGSLARFAGTLWNKLRRFDGNVLKTFFDALITLAHPPASYSRFIAEGTLKCKPRNRAMLVRLSCGLFGACSCYQQLLEAATRRMVSGEISMKFISLEIRNSNFEFLN